MDTIGHDAPNACWRKFFSSPLGGRVCLISTFDNIDSKSYNIFILVFSFYYHVPYRLRFFPASSKEEVF